jgi:hypothetical protein
MRIADPFTTLGLDPRAPFTPESVQTAFRAAIAATPPEQHAERTRELVEARDLLLQPKHALTRLLGDLRVPDAKHFVPGHVPQQAPGAAPAPIAKTGWSARSRLVAILTLYALLEAELESPGGPETGLLFE